jgi:hypothetical protein
MTENQFDKAKEISFKIAQANADINELDDVIRYLKREISDFDKKFVFLTANGYCKKFSVDIGEFIYFIEAQKAKKTEEVHELKKEFEEL